MLVSIIQRIKFFSTVVGDSGILGRQIEIKAWHQILRHRHIASFCASLEQTH